MLAGIREILIISNDETIPFYKKLFRDGTHIGLKISYEIQDKPRGLADAFRVGKSFVGNDSVTMILGDNIFYGKLDFVRKAVKENKGATVFGYYVNDPKRYGVVEFDDNRKVVSIEEKPKEPKSNYAVVGLYIYNNDVIEIAENLKPSARGELEITDVNKEYLMRNKLDVKLFGRGVAWLDTGTPDALLEASTFIGAIEKRQGLKVACIEEIAHYKGWITSEQLIELAQPLKKTEYGQYMIEMAHMKLNQC